MGFITDARSAELNAASRMRELGFRDAQATLVGADSGIDVWASGGIAQVKWQAAQVPRSDVQKLFGARGHNRKSKLLFFSKSGYSRHALQSADQLGVLLFILNVDGSATPENQLAKDLVAKFERRGQKASRIQMSRPGLRSTTIPIEAVTLDSHTRARQARLRDLDRRGKRPSRRVTKLLLVILAVICALPSLVMVAIVILVWFEPSNSLGSKFAGLIVGLTVIAVSLGCSVFLWRANKRREVV